MTSKISKTKQVSITQRVFGKTRQYDKIYQYDKKDKTKLLANFSLFFCEFYNFARKLK